MSLPPFSTPISLSLENRNHLWKDSLGMHSERMGKKPEGKIGKTSNKSSDRTQAVLRTEMLPCFPELDRKRQIELKYCLPFSLKITLGLGLWFLFTSYWRHQLSTEPRDFCLLGRPLSRQLPRPPPSRRPKPHLPAWIAAAAAARAQKTGCACEQGRRSLFPS